MIAERSFPDADSMAEAVAAEIAAALEAAVAARGRASFVATGGTTPEKTYRALAKLPAPWSRVTVTLSDERWVPVDNPASNEGMVRRALLQEGAAAANFVPLKTSHARAADAVEAVAAALADAPQPFDVCLLGLGADGHVASLFPGAPLHRDTLVQAVTAPGAAGAAERISLTLSTLVASRRIVLMFTGPEKLAIYRAARDGLSESPAATLIAGARERILACWTKESPP